MDGGERVMAAGKARLSVAGPELLCPRAESEHDERGVADREDGLRGLLQPALPTQTAEEQDDPPLRWDIGRRPDQVRARITWNPARLAVEEDRRVGRERPDPLDVIGDRVVDGHDRVGPADPASLTDAVSCEDRPRHLAVVVRVEDDVDDVVHDAPGTAALPGIGGQVVRHGDRQNPEGVVEVGRRQLPTECRPPATHRQRPECSLAKSIEQEGGDPPRALRRRGALRTLGPADPPTGRNVATDEDAAVAFLEWGAVGGQRGDLDLPAGRGEATGDAQPARVGRRRVGNEENGPATADSPPAHRLTTAAP